MTVISTHYPEGAEPTSLRAQSKLKTRRRVLDAARGLFMSRGYEAATIRDIAAEAGLSTGAVFASFLDKNDLFNAVMAEDFQMLIEGLRQGEQPDAAVDEGLLAIFKVGYRCHLSQLPLLRAAISLSWSHGLGGEFGDRPSFDVALRFLIGVLERGVERSELTADIDPRLLADILWNSYVANYRRALFDNWTEDQLVARSQSQIAAILKGYRAA